MKVSGVGIDVVTIARFRSHAKNRNSKFMQSTFSKQELDYCSRYKDASTHLAGIFAAKEAVVKAYGGKVHVREVEVRHRKSGQPEIFIKDRRAKLLISIAHDTSIACAIAVRP